MAQVKVIILDDDGQELSNHIHGLGDGLEQLNTMERNIEKLRPTILGDITRDLLTAAQSADCKKKGKSKRFPDGDD